MIPAFFVHLDKFPITPNGKLDRNQLMEPNVEMFKTEYVAPQTEMEERITSAFETVLGLNQVGVNDDFFLLGGDSIKTMMLQNELNIPGLSSELIYQKKTPAKIAQNLSEETRDILGEIIGSNVNRSPLTPNQIGMYLAYLANPESTIYNTPMKFEIPESSDIDINRLVEAIKKTLNNHLAFQIVIDDSEGEPVMIKKSFNPEITVKKTDNLEEDIKAFVKPFDLREGPLYHIEILQTEKGDVLLLDFHHIVFDGTSVNIFMSEVGKNYAGEEVLEEQVTPFDLSLYEEEILNSEQYEKDKEYFTAELEGIEGQKYLIPDYRENLNSSEHPGKFYNKYLDDSLSTQTIETFTNQTGVTENSFFLGALAYAAAKYLGEKETVINSISPGRMDGRLNNMIGMNVRTLPVNLAFEEEDEIDNFLKKVEEKQHEAISHQYYPFTELSEKYHTDKNIMFAYQSDSFNKASIGENILEMERIPVEDAMAPLSFMVFKSNGRYMIEVEYQSNLYSQETIDNFVNFYIHILEEMLNRKRLIDINLVDEDEMDKVIELSRELENDIDYNYSFLERFKESVKNFPDNIAVVFGDKKYSYKELDRLTDNLAQYLIKQGVQKGDFIAVMVKRSELVALLPIAILKAGAAYLPLDTKLPPERIEFILEDSNAPIVLADSDLTEKLKNYKGNIIDSQKIFELSDAEIELPEIEPEDAFSLIYTSGSTGTPKGVVLTHRNFTGLSDWFARLENMDENFSSLIHDNFAFDAHSIGIYPVLSTGGTSYIIPEDKVLDLLWINEYARENNITHTDVTAQICKSFISLVDDIAFKIISTGGETLTPFEPIEGLTIKNSMVQLKLQ